MKTPHILPGLRLEVWNGVHWECGHRAHERMTEASWREIRPFAGRWSCAWRVLEVRVRAKSKKRPKTI